MSRPVCLLSSWAFVRPMSICFSMNLFQSLFSGPPGAASALTIWEIVSGADMAVVIRVAIIAACGPPFVRNDRKFDVSICSGLDASERRFDRPLVSMSLMNRSPSVSASMSTGFSFSDSGSFCSVPVDLIFFYLFGKILDLLGQDVN